MIQYFPLGCFLFPSVVSLFFVTDVFCNNSISENRTALSSVTANNVPGGVSQGFASSRLETSNVIAGKEALDFELEDLVGRKVTLKDFRGNLVLLNFWATWCLPCVSEMAALERLFKTYEKQGLQIVAVNVDAKNNAARVRDFVKSKGLSFTVLLDPNMRLPEQYGITGFPETFFIDAQGKIRLVHDPESNEDVVRLLSDRPWDSKLYLKLVGEFLPMTQPSKALFFEQDFQIQHRWPKFYKVVSANIIDSAARILQPRESVFSQLIQFHHTLSSPSSSQPRLASVVPSIFS